MKWLLSTCTVLLIFIAWLGPARTISPPSKGYQDPTYVIDQTQYSGSKSCVTCHQGYYDSWKDSAHNKMIRPAIFTGKNKNVLADFSKQDPNRTFNAKDVRWVIRHRWKQRFIGVVDGQEVVFPGQWSIKDQKWQPYTGKSDWWYPKHPDWKTRSNFKLCAGCHSTGTNIATQTWTEQNITCESCHGPGKSHSQKPDSSNIVNPSKLSTEKSMQICLSCHQAGKPNSEEIAWPAGYQPGKDLNQYWHGFAPKQGVATAEFWENGTAHKNRVQGNTFVRSYMHAKGIQCSTCHDSHGSRNLSMTVKSASTNALCNSCHGPGKISGPNFAKLSDHTHHLPNSTGSQCINCHMPKTGENSVGAESRDHTFNFIYPSLNSGSSGTPAKTAPNSCNLCHTDKSTEWSMKYVQEWYANKKN